MRPAEILLVEDNPGDVKLTRKALDKAKLANNLHVVENGNQALQWLRNEAPYEDSPRPDLMLLDLNLPGKDGRTVLREIKGDKDLQSIPVVVLTSSKAEQDVLETYHLHANCYVTKPVDMKQFLHVVQSIEDFWVSIVTLPESQ